MAINSNFSQLDESLITLKKQLMAFKLISILAVFISVSLGIYNFVKDSQNSKVFKTQGIIITDANGVDRILIGSPVPFSPDRVRTDSVKAWETYVTRWPENMRDKIWNWFKDYNHSTNGIIFLSETGHDRLALGDPTPDPTIGKRIFPSTGLILMDEKGDERSGYGIMNQGEDVYKVVLGLDSNKGTEGIALIVDDDGYNGIIVPGKEKTIFLGNADTTFWATAPYEIYNGLIIRSKDSIFQEIK